MSKKLIVFATKEEAHATLHTLKATPLSQHLFIFEGGKILVCGMGIHAAILHVTQYASQIEEVWNFGLAGSLHQTIPIGSCIEIHTVGKYTPIGALPPFSLCRGKHRLITSDCPIHDHTHRSFLAQNWEMVDMEGYGIAYAAHTLGKKCRIWKIISDFAAPGGQRLIRKHMATLSEQLAHKIYEIIYASRPHS